MKFPYSDENGNLDFKLVVFVLLVLFGLVMGVSYITCNTTILKTNHANVCNSTAIPY